MFNRVIYINNWDHDIPHELPQNELEVVISHRIPYILTIPW